MNREEHLQKTFPLKDGTTYIQNLDKHNKRGAGGNRVVKRKNLLIVALSRIKAVFNEILLGFKWAEENRDKNGFGKL